MFMVYLSSYTDNNDLTRRFSNGFLKTRAFGNPVFSIVDDQWVYLNRQILDDNMEKDNSGSQHPDL